MHKQYNPVLELMRERMRQKSTPSSRRDNARLAVVIEGGGMRGIITAGMTAAIEQLGLTNTIDHVYGTSAGALNGAFLISGQATWSTTLFYDYLNNEKFLDMNRLILGKPAVDMDYLDDVYINKRRLNYRAILDSMIQLHCMATDVQTGKTLPLGGFTTQNDIRNALLAASRIPVVVGEPLDIKGHKYIDAALGEPVPVRAALQHNATHVLVLHSRPRGAGLKNSAVDAIVERYLGTISPALVKLYQNRVANYTDIQNFIATKQADTTHQPYVCSIYPPTTTHSISELEKNRNKLIHAAMAGLQSMEEAYTGEHVVVEEVLRAFPADWYGFESPA